MDIRVFTGGCDGAQTNHFRQAFQDLDSRTSQFKVTYVSIKQVKDAGWTPTELVSWLASGDVHFFLSHIHQGLSAKGESQMGWNMIDLHAQLARLRFHPGFPTGDLLACPVFTQNKIGYLKAIPTFVNPSLQVILMGDEGFSYESEELLRYEILLNKRKVVLTNLLYLSFSFVTDTSRENGWVVKMPYTTNGEFVKFCKDYDDVLYALKAASEKYFGRVSYAIVQPCMKNRKEYKVVVLGGIAKYVARIENKCASQRCFSTSPHTALFAFAENAVQALKRACPNSIADGILRVDIFQTVDGCLVVNEFESLEACTYATSAKKEASAHTWMVNFWRQELDKSIKLAFSLRN